jgi:tetratricopeptide (TPR) repeat protein
VIELLLAAENALALGLLDQAERTFHQVLASDPRNGIAAVGLARVALERGDDARALELARAALEIDPENATARRMIDRMEEVARYRAAAGTPSTSNPLAARAAANLPAANLPAANLQSTSIPPAAPAAANLPSTSIPPPAPAAANLPAAPSQPAPGLPAAPRQPSAPSAAAPPMPAAGRPPTATPTRPAASRPAPSRPGLLRRLLRRP